MKKWAIGIFSSVVVIFVLVGFRDRLIQVWASPDKVSTIEKKVEKQETIQDQLSKLVVEQNARLEKQEIVSALSIKALDEQIKSSKEQIALIAEIKKKR